MAAAATKEAVSSEAASQDVTFKSLVSLVTSWCTVKWEIILWTCAIVTLLGSDWCAVWSVWSSEVEDANCHPERSSACSLSRSAMHNSCWLNSEKFGTFWSQSNRLVSLFCLTNQRQWEGRVSPCMILKVIHAGSGLWNLTMEDRFKYHIVENFQGRKLSQIGGKYDFCRENFCSLLTCATPKDVTSPNF